MNECKHNNHSHGWIWLFVFIQACNTCALWNDDYAVAGRTTDLNERVNHLEQQIQGCKKE